MLDRAFGRRGPAAEIPEKPQISGNSAQVLSRYFFSMLGWQVDFATSMWGMTRCWLCAGISSQVEARLAIAWSGPSNSRLILKTQTTLPPSLTELVGGSDERMTIF